MKPRILPTTRLSFPLASAIAAMLVAQSASAADYYWDTNDATIGFGTAGGTWLAPTPGPTAGWTTDSTGATAIGSITTATTDNLFFGSTAWIPSGAITVSGTVDAGNLTFAAGTALTLSGGTAINLAAASTIDVKSFNSATIGTGLSGAATSLTKNGFGILTLQGANTYGGATVLNGAGLITLSTTGTINSTSGITFNGASLTLTNLAGEGAVDRLSTGTITSNGGTLTYSNANTAANTYTEGAGTLALTTGQFNTVLGTNQNTSNGQTLTFGGLTQSGTSAVTFSANTTGPQASGNKNMIVVSGKGTTTTGQIIGSWATTGTAANAQSDYAVYNADYIVPANITATGESTWTNSASAYTSSGATVALSGDRAMAALRNTGGVATITLSDGTTGYKLATNGILNGVTTLLTIAPGTVSGSVTAPGVSGGQIHMTTGTVNGGITVSAPINNNGGAVTLVKNGVGTLILNSATSDYSGGTVINSGILVFGSGTLGVGGITINGGSSGATTFGRLQWASDNTQDISSSLTMVNGGNANLSTGGNNVAFANAVGSNSSSNLTKLSTGQLTFDANNTYTGETGVYQGTLLVNVAQTNTTSIRVGNSTVNGSAAAGLAILKLGVNNALPTNIPVMVDGQQTNTLDLNGFDQTVGHLSLGSNSGGASGTVSGTGTSKLTLTAGVTADGHNQGGSNTAAGLISTPFLDLNNASQTFNTVGAIDGRTTLTISSVIQNGGINKTGIAGQLRLSGDNTFSGSTTISAGVIRLDHSLALKNSALDTTNSVAGSSLDGLRINTGVTAVTLGGLIGNKNFAATGGVISTTTGGYGTLTALTLNPGTGQSHSYSGVIANGATGMTLTKTGAGTQSLSNTNLYTGATNVNVGTLSIDGAGTINTSSGVTINGGTFRYNSSTHLSPAVTFTSGTVAGTNWNGTLAGLTVGTGQTISPGNSPGTATTASQTWTTGGSYLWEINNATGTAGVDPGWDLVNGTGTLDISATNVSPFNILVTSLTLANAGGLATNFNDATSYNWLIADFNSVTNFVADKFFVNTSGFTNTFTGTFDVALGGGALPGDSSQIYLTYTAVPEPGSALLGALGMLALLRRRRG